MATTDVAQATAGAGHDAHEHGDHVVPIWILATIWLSLMALTGATVAIAQFDLGSLDLVLAMAIATVKATLVCLFFMHLYWERPIMGMMFLGCLFFVFLFISFVVVDSAEYMPDVEARQRDAPVILQSETAAPQ